MCDGDAIVLSGVEKRFGKKRVLAGLDLRVPRGRTLALLGRNGAGKSTILRILVGLLPRDRGEVRVAGLDPARKPREVKAAVGYVAEATAFHPRWRVREAIGLVRSIRKKRWDALEEARLVKAFDLPLAERIGSLSKGARAKLALLLALGHRPGTILLDEPASGLDPVVRREVLASLVDAIHEEGRTVLLSSHRMEDVERLADRVAFLAGGRIVLEGGTEAVRARARRVVVGPLRAGEPLPGLPGDPLVTRREEEAVLTYLSGVGEAVEALRRRFPEVTEIGVNLEEIFVDLLHQSEKGAAPCGA